MKNYLRGLWKILLYYFALAALGIGFLTVLQWCVLGGAYRATLPVFVVTASALELVLFLGLGTALLYTIIKLKIDAWIRLGRLAVMFSLILFLY